MKTDMQDWLLEPDDETCDCGDYAECPECRERMCYDPYDPSEEEYSE